MNLKRQKNLAKTLLKEFNNEEDNEGMTVGSVLAPSASVTGGNITNSDSYAPGDTRIPKSLFGKKIFRRKIKKNNEEDEEFISDDDIPSNIFTDEEWEQIERDVDAARGSMYEMKLKRYKEKDRSLTPEEIKKGFQEIRDILEKIDKNE